MDMISRLRHLAKEKAEQEAAQAKAGEQKTDEDQAESADKASTGEK